MGLVVIIVLATLTAGIGSVWVAALLMRVGLDKPTPSVGAQQLLSLAAGALLATAFMHLLPEAFEGPVEAHQLFPTLLIGVVFFFLLDKAELWHHGHEHHHPHPPVHEDHPPHSHSHSRNTPTGGWSVLTGDSVHCFGDGVLIASAFVADMRLGLVAALSVLAHEVPHHIGDLMVLRQSSASRRMALMKVSLAGGVTMLGGLAGYFLVGQWHDWLPYFLVIASSSFIYVALADLIPQLQQRLSTRETLVQITALLLGIAMVTLVSSTLHHLAEH